MTDVGIRALIYWAIVFPPMIGIFFSAQRYFFFKRNLTWNAACNRAAVVSMLYAAAVLFIILAREVL